jgi:cytochrome P450
VFEPERWLREASGGAKSNYAFMTFIHGPRSCIGEKFSRGEFATLVAAWVGRFEWALADEKVRDEGSLEIKGGITSKPANGMWTRVRRVEGW